MFDNTDTDSLELLRFYPSLTAISGFEEALHERVRQVGRLADHAFPLIVAVERLEGDGALALVSTHVPGKRLSVFFDRPGPRNGLNPSFVTGIVTQVTQALVLLQGKGESIAHSAVTPERIIVTMGGRICVVEHVLGAALRRLNLSASQLWREFGLVTAAEHRGTAALDARTDVFQLGVLATELLLGRRLAPLELKDRLPDLLDQWTAAATRSGATSDRLRQWLERALQFGGRGYASAAEAFADLRDVPAESAASAIDSLPATDPDIEIGRTLRAADLTLRRSQSQAEPGRGVPKLAATADLTASASPEDGSRPPHRTMSAPGEDGSRPEVQPLRPSLVRDSRRPDVVPESKPAPATKPRPVTPPPLASHA